MAKIDLPTFLKTQISLTEWFEKTNHHQTEAFRTEESTRDQRQRLFHKIIGLPFDDSTKFDATDLADQTPKFKQFMTDHAGELCALRLVGKDPKTPKLRVRGLTVEAALTWFKEQQINPADYHAFFIPHTNDASFSSIFIVNQHGIFGEVIPGLAFQLTQGFYESGQPVSFAFDFKKLTLSTEVPDVRKYVEDVLIHLKVTDPKKQSALTQELNVSFAHHYICGYWETITTEEYGLWFLDFNRILGELYKDFTIDLNKPTDSLLTGRPSSPGQAKGKVRRILSSEIDAAQIEIGEILVCDMTTPAHLPLMKKASAIITDLGGILSHAAIVSRELKIPCITSTGQATQLLQTGDLIEIDATLGTVRKIFNEKPRLV